jgi:hypothetical protein
LSGSLKSQKSDLRPVAMGNHQLMAGPHQLGEGCSGSAHIASLHFRRHRFAAAKKRIAAQGHYH